MPNRDDLRRLKRYGKDFEVCLPCTKNKISDWFAWPLIEPVPSLKIIRGESCDDCGGIEFINSNQIRWINCHGAGNTGLPDGFKLEIIMDLERIDDLAFRWGYPYLEVRLCPACKGDMIVSYHDPGVSRGNGDRNTKFRHQCSCCEKGTESW